LVVASAVVVPPVGAARAGRPGRTSPLRAAGVRTLGAVHLAYWVCMGAMWVLVPAFATRVGEPGQAGLLVAAWSAGSLAGGVLLAVRRGRVRLRAAYLALLATLAVTSLPLALPATVPQMAAVIAVFGLGLSPWLAVSDQLVAEVAPSGRAVEAYGWLAAAGQAGGAIGAAAAGVLADRHGGGVAFLLVSAALLAGLGIAVSGRRTLRATVPVERTPAEPCTRSAG
jgi:MFS family permease